MIDRTRILNGAAGDEKPRKLDGDGEESVFCLMNGMMVRLVKRGGFFFGF